MTSPLPNKVFVTFILIFIFAGFSFIYYLYSILNTQPGLLKINRTHPLTSDPVSVSLNLSSPSNQILVYEPDLLIEGQTTPSGIVIISFLNLDQIIEASNKGQFSHTAQLTEGVNLFKVTSYDTAGNSKTESRTVYYSKEKI